MPFVTMLRRFSVVATSKRTFTAFCASLRQSKKRRRSLWNASDSIGCPFQWTSGSEYLPPPNRKNRESHDSGHLKGAHSVEEGYVYEKGCTREGRYLFT